MDDVLLSLSWNQDTGWDRENLAPITLVPLSATTRDQNRAQSLDFHYRHVVGMTEEDEHDKGRRVKQGSRGVNCRLRAFSSTRGQLAGLRTPVFVTGTSSFISRKLGRSTDVIERPCDCIARNGIRRVAKRTRTKSREQERGEDSPRVVVSSISLLGRLVLTGRVMLVTISERM